MPRRVSPKLCTVSHAAAEPKKNRAPLIVLIVAALLVLGLIVFAISRGGAPEAGDTSAVPSSSSTSAAVAPDSASSAAASCTTATAGFEPDRFVIERVGADEPVVSLNLDSEGNVAAPPLDEPRMASWWNAGPMPGSDKGKTLLNIHTYRNGGALGNELYADGASALQPGDLIKLYGAGGEVQCYEFTQADKIWVSEYDPDSDVMVDFDGDPQLLIIICWDFNAGTEDWDSRIFFHAKPVAA